MTLWGEPEQIHVQNTEQLNAHDRHQNVTVNSGQEYHDTKSTNTCTTQDQ